MSINLDCFSLYDTAVYIPTRQTRHMSRSLECEGSYMQRKDTAPCKRSSLLIPASPTSYTLPFSLLFLV
jgi:hypothetical protein